MAILQNNKRSKKYVSQWNTSSIRRDWQCILYLKMLLDELLNNDHQKTIPIKCFVDNSDLVKAIKSTKLVDKRLRTEITSIKEILDNWEICSITWLKSNDQIANCLTKRGALPYYMIDWIMERRQKNEKNC